MVGHGCMTQQLDHSVVMFVRSLDEETPEFAPFSIKHAELERNTQKSFQRVQAVILMSFGHVLRRALQRVERATIVLARLVNSAHDSLIPADELLGVHLRNEVKRGDGVVARSVIAE